MIAIVDYGMGNLRSVQKGFARVGFEAVVTQDPQTIHKAKGLVVPGVGAFKKAMENLAALHLIDPLRDAIAEGKPFLGICLGFQLLFSESEEFGKQKGLGVLKGKVVRFPFAPSTGNSEALKVPHMGWNSIQMRKAAPALADVKEGAFFYFVHSYYPIPEDPEIVATTTEYGLQFASSVSRGNLFACQFHPEKSQRVGLQILKNFGGLVQK